MTLKLRTKLASAIVACAGGAYSYYVLGDRKVVFNSWTTNHNPSVTWDWNWDKRDQTSLVKPSSRSLDENDNVTDTTATSKASRHMIFIRHGQYNMDGLKDVDKYLSKLGQEQAALTGERLRSLRLPYNRFVYSSMTRATETANIILKSLPNLKEVEKCDMLREGAPIPPEPPIGNWKPERYKFFIDGSRIEAAFRKYMHRAPPSQTDDSYEIYVCHANVIRYFVCRFFKTSRINNPDVSMSFPIPLSKVSRTTSKRQEGLQLPPEAWLRLSLHNGSMTYMVIRPDGRVSLRTLGDAGYMAPDKLSLG